MKQKAYNFAGTAMFEIGRIFMDKEMYFTAVEYFLKSQMIMDDNRMESVYKLIGIGNCYYHTGNYPMATQYYRKSEKLFLHTNDLYGVAVALNNIGLIHQQLRQYDSALWYFNKALEARVDLNPQGLIGHSYYYIGTTYVKLGDTTRAKHYLEMAIPILLLPTSDHFIRLDFLTTLAGCHFELGMLDFGQQVYPAALSKFRTAVTIADSIRQRLTVPLYLLAIGETYSKMGKEDSAMVSFRQALFITDSAESLDNKKTCYESIINHLFKFGKIDSAGYYFKKYKLVVDEIKQKMNNSKVNEIGLALQVKDNESQSIARSERFSNMVILFSIIGAFLMIILIITLIYSRKQKKNIEIAQGEILARKSVETELEKANADLKEINFRKDRFISILSHDLRSPFNVIMGFSDLIVEDAERKELTEILSYAKTLQQASRSTYQLLDNLLTWSRLEMGKIPFKPEPVYLYNAVWEVTELLSVVASPKMIYLRNLVASDAQVKADINILQAILRNIISNAIKFSRNGGVVEIRSEPAEEWMKVIVSDNGVGIPTEIQNSLFRNSTEIITSKGTANEKGHGFGLILCRYMVELHGGQIWLESTSPGGSTFIFTLPACPE
jgi:signal transduction histidine kinase/Tfp pilus assembly protein PilF